MTKFIKLILDDKEFKYLKNKKEQQEDMQKKKIKWEDYFLLVAAKSI